MTQGTVKVTVEEIGKKTALVFRPDFIKDKEVYLETMKSLRNHCLYHSRIGHYIYFPCIEISHLEDELSVNLSLEYSNMAEGLFQRARNLRYLSELDKNKSLEELVQNSVLDSLRKSVILHNLNLTEILAKNADLIEDRIFKFSDIVEKTFFDPDYETIIVYGVNKLKKGDLPILKDLIEEFNCIFLTSVDMKKDPKKTFELYNLVNNERYANFSEYRRLNMEYNAKEGRSIHRFKHIGCMAI